MDATPSAKHKFGKARVPGCYCTNIQTCAPCLNSVVYFWTD